MKLHWSMEYMPNLLEGYQPPTEAFEPGAAWEHQYMLATIIPSLGEKKAYDSGQCVIRRMPLDNGLVQFNVLQEARMSGRSFQRITATIEARDDILSTPVRWTTCAEHFTADGELLPDQTVKESGEIKAGRLVRIGAVRRSTPAPRPVTTNWTLFDAVQRFRGKRIPELEFEMLEETDLLRSNQFLKDREKVTLSFGGDDVPLRAYFQTGQGILPHHYFVDKHHRLLFAIGGLKTYILKSSAML